MCKMIALIISLLLQGTTANRNALPVLLIDTDNTMKDLRISTNPFSTMSSDAFTEIVRSASRHSDRVIMFVEDYFSVEDIASRDAKGSPYDHNIHQGYIDGKISYIPSVIEPFKVLKKLFTPLEGNVFHLSDAVKTFGKNFKYYYIFFQDAGQNETRVEKLRRHDEIIRIAYYSIRHESPGSIVAFYTGKSNPHQLASGRAGHVPPPSLPPVSQQIPQDVMIVTDGALFRLNGVYWTAGARRAAQAPPVVAGQRASRRGLATRMLYSDFELEFNFRYLPHEWMLESVSLLEGGEEVGRTVMAVCAPYDTSYVCAEPIHIHNARDGSLVTVSQYQVEALKTHMHEDAEPQPDAPEGPAPPPGKHPQETAHESDPESENRPEEAETEEKKLVDDLNLRTPTTVGKTNFTNKVDCGPYFSSNILAGLFVTALLLSIMFYGIVTLFNCETNGRYDDANQKPLVIVSQL